MIYPQLCSGSFPMSEAPHSGCSKPPASVKLTTRVRGLLPGHTVAAHVEALSSSRVHRPHGKTALKACEKPSLEGGSGCFRCQVC